MSTATAPTRPDSAPLDPANTTGTGSRHLSLALIVISMAQLMLVLDELIVNTALPHVQRTLHFSGTGLEWVVTAYALTFGGLLMIGGRAGDVLGRRRIFIAGILVFSIASLLGGLAITQWWLLAARALQGVGAAMAAPAALSLITVTFPAGRARARALGVYAAMTGAGGSIGLVVGGLLTSYASWRWVFFVNVPIGLALAFATPIAIPETRRHPRRLDLPGAVAGTAAFTLLVYGLTRAAAGPDGVSHWSDDATITCLAASVVALATFIAIEFRTDHPLMPLRIFTNRNRAGAYLMIICVATALFGMFFFLTLFMQNVWGWSALKAGAAYLPLSLGIIVVAGICSVLLNRIGARRLMTAGTMVAAGGMLWLSRIDEHSTYLGSMFGPMLVVAAGAGMIFVPIATTVVTGVSEQDTGVASSMFNAGQQIGGAIGLATVGTVVWTTVNNTITHHLAADPAAPAAVTAPPPGSSVYSHALSLGAGVGLGIGGAALVLAFLVAVITIRLRREDLPTGAVIRRPDPIRQSETADPKEADMSETATATSHNNNTRPGTIVPVPPSIIVRMVMRPMTRALNPVIGKLAGKRHFAMAAQIRHHGRRSGRTYLTPVTARIAGDTIWIALTFGNQSDWSRNVRAAGECTIRIAGHEYHADTPRFINRADAGPALRTAFKPAERVMFRLLGIKQFLCLQATVAHPSHG